MVPEMKPLFAPMIVTLLCAGVTACGGESKRDNPVVSATKSSAMGSSVAIGGSRTSRIAARNVSRTVSKKGYLNDGDHDHIGDPDRDNNDDDDKDAYLDYKPDDNGSYNDSDDGSVLAYGDAPSAAEARKIAIAVTRYQAAAAAVDGAAACRQLTASLANAVALDYGRFGAPYLRRGKTCARVMALLFRHFHRQLAESMLITSVRVRGARAIALLGSKDRPASYIPTEREGAVWKIAQVLGSPLP
jgi:hypothetical protein